MPEFIKKILRGVQQWTEKKLEEISLVISVHINSLTERITMMENTLDPLAYTVASHICELRDRINVEETVYNKQELYSNNNTMLAKGIAIKIGKMVHLYVNSAKTYSGVSQQYMCYELPYKYDTDYSNIANNGGVYECLNISFRIEFDAEVINNTTYNVIKLTKQNNGSDVSWDGTENIYFKLDYVAL